MTVENHRPSSFNAVWRWRWSKGIRVQRTSCGCCGCAQPPDSPRRGARHGERERERSCVRRGESSPVCPYILLVVGMWLEISFVWLLHTRTVNALRLTSQEEQSFAPVRASSHCSRRSPRPHASRLLLLHVCEQAGLCVAVLCCVTTNNK